MTNVCPLPSSPQDRPTPHIEPTSETAQPATNGGRSEPATAHQRLLARIEAMIGTVQAKTQPVRAAITVLAMLVLGTGIALVLAILAILAAVGTALMVPVLAILAMWEAVGRSAGDDRNDQNRARG